ncbi:MAG: helix-turn-helix domain-containing protein [Rhodocyclaceae bacterium]|nr:helix-turn-helix domain-containing protein [Rhodocyclaceae bacterium]
MASGEDASSAGSGREASLQDHLDRVEKQAIMEALQKTRFNRTAAAKLLGVTFRSLRYRMERLGLNE